jgi:hypothetical protein
MGYGENNMAIRVKCPECERIYSVRNAKSPMPRHYLKGMPKYRSSNWTELWCPYSGKPGIPETEWEEAEEIEAGGE